jgi:hypothetical protein
MLFYPKECSKFLVMPNIYCVLLKPLDPHQLAYSKKLYLQMNAGTLTCTTGMLPLTAVTIVRFLFHLKCCTIRFTNAQILLCPTRKSMLEQLKSLDPPDLAAEDGLSSNEGWNVILYKKHTTTYFSYEVRYFRLLQHPQRWRVQIGLHHPLDGVTNPEYKLLCFIQLTIFLQREEGTSF